MREGVGAAVRAAGRHWMLLVALALGIALRIVTQFAYQPALLYIDSLRYLQQLPTLDPTGPNPIGYDVLVLRPVLAVSGFGAVVAAQHATGVLMAVAIYVLLVRNGCWRWLAAVATLPVLLDSYQLQIEQNIMSDEPFQVLLVLLVLVLAWKRPVGPLPAAAAGLVCAAAVTVRLVAVALIVPVAVYVILAAVARYRADHAAWWRSLSAVAALAVTFAVGIGGYAAYFHSWTGRWSITASTGGAIYGRTAVAADCTALHVDPAARGVCPAEPRGRRRGPDFYTHDQNSPALRLYFQQVPGDEVTARTGRFNHAVLTQQPGRVAVSALGDFAKNFRWTKVDAPGDVPVNRWYFQTGYPVYSLDPAHIGPPEANLDSVGALRQAGYPGPMVNTGLATFLHDYQSGGGYVPGTLLGIALAAGLAGFAGRRRDLRLLAFLTTGTTVVLLGVAAATEFSWRYQLPGVVLAPLAGAVGVTAWRRLRTTRTTRTPPTTPPTAWRPSPRPRPTPSPRPRRGAAEQ